MRIAFLLPLFAACSSDGGTAPAISNLTFTPATVTHGMQASVTCSIMFDDKDGDLDKLAGEVTLPDSTKAQLQSVDLGPFSEQTHGTIPFALSFIPPAVGTYGFSLWLTDDGDNKSNVLDGMLTAN
jgi:hypothetical protein